MSVHEQRTGDQVPGRHRLFVAAWRDEHDGSPDAATGSLDCRDPADDSSNELHRKLPVGLADSNGVFAVVRQEMRVGNARAIFHDDQADAPRLGTRP